MGLGFPSFAGKYSHFQKDIDEGSISQEFETKRNVPQTFIIEILTEN